MKYLIPILFVINLLITGCYNKIVFVEVTQEAGEQNSLNLDDNILDTETSLEGDAQPVIETDL